MKNRNKEVLILIIGLSLMIACKKKTEVVSTPTTITPNAPAQVSPMTAKVDNQAWSVEFSEYTNATSISKSGTNYSFEGRSAFYSPYSYIRFALTPSTGIFNLSGSKVNYRNSTGPIFSATSGTINITTFDTTGANNKIIKKLKATFSFITDTIGGVSHQITEGVIDYSSTN
jgi:hypothetical protein